MQSEQPGLSCSVVDVSYAAFRAVVPQLGELRYLAHVRQVDAGDQEALAVPAPGWYSVVAGNRLPGAADGIYIAHLVSLEGFAADLPDQPARTGYSLVRLISLASWTFTSSTGTGDFAALAAGLGLGSFTVPVPVTGTDAASQLVSGALADGYTLLGYTTRLGEQTAAWYRGPCVPAQVTANPQPPFPTASAALVYDQATGMFDVSYAAAWEIGRLLTLANGPVSQSLATWTGAAVTASRLLLERSATAPGRAAPPASPAGRRRTATRRPGRLIVEHVVPSLFGNRTAPGPRSARQTIPPGLRGREPVRRPRRRDAAPDRCRRRPLRPAPGAGPDPRERTAGRERGDGRARRRTSSRNRRGQPAEQRRRPGGKPGSPRPGHDGRAASPAGGAAAAGRRPRRPGGGPGGRRAGSRGRHRLADRAAAADRHPVLLTWYPTPGCCPPSPSGSSPSTRTGRRPSSTAPCRSAATAAPAAAAIAALRPAADGRDRQRAGLLGVPAALRARLRLAGALGARLRGPAGHHGGAAARAP